MKTGLRWLLSGGMFAAGISLVVSNCERRAPDAAAGNETPPQGGVCAANYPLAYFAGTLLAGAAPVIFDAPPDEDPAFWQPDDAALQRFQQASVILMNGAGYSKWADQASLPQARVVDTSAAFANALIEVKAGATHSHGPTGEHSHGGTAFTTWIDFDQAAKQLDATARALLPLVPAEEQAAFEKRRDDLREQLLALDQRALEAGKKLAGTNLLGSHPVYQYLARRYRLNIREMHFEPDIVPDGEALEELRQALKDHPAAIMLWEAPPAAETVSLLKSMGIRSVVFDPCGNRPEQGDFLSVMESNVAVLESLAN